jgi:cell division protein FtsZ
VIINISGDISLMDANDAASYVQDLAGDDANIIFGAKFDETMTDEATITVIATGLENATSKQPGKIMPTLQYQTAAGMPKSSVNTAVNRQALGMMSNAGHTAGTSQAQPVQQPTPSFGGIQKPRQPESTVQQVDIKIPDFLKNSRR